ncbi:MAG: hypothetical protein A2Z29_02480 [Chloroflexi bacterium RBG_16_56_11]|nr:MAG: hypothetical protein A2Z29_02480 [Chloroflexi bacterium RBG_16_56_11]
MIFTEETRQICRLFGDLLDYPGEGLAAAAEDCAGRMKAHFNGASDRVRAFADFVGSQPPGTMEELYTRTFDMTPANTLYIGYHVFGESPRRSVFLVRLREAFQSRGFEAGTELPDHLAVLLRFLSVTDDPEFVSPLVHDAILPVLDKMVKSFPGDSRGYGPVVKSLRQFLARSEGGPVKKGGSSDD